MARLFPMLIALLLAGCGKCPQECTPEALLKCDNGSLVFKSKVIEKIAAWQTQIAAYDQSRGFFQPSFASMLDDVVERNQSTWNANHMSAYQSLAKNDLHLICKFAAEDTFGHGELTNLSKILTNVVAQQKAANESLLLQTSSEAVANIK